MKKLLFLCLFSLTAFAWADSDPLKLNLKWIMPQQDYQAFANNLDVLFTRIEAEAAERKQSSNTPAALFKMCVRAQQLEKIFANNQQHRQQYDQENGKGAFDYAAYTWRDSVAQTRSQCDAAQAAARQHQ